MKINIFKQKVIRDKKITLIQYNDNILVFDKDIGLLYDLFCNDIRRKVDDTFQEDIDYIDLKNCKTKNKYEILMKIGYNQIQVSTAKHIYLFSSSGYIKLFKHSNKWWNKEYQYIYGELLNNCFTEKPNNQLHNKFKEGLIQNNRNKLILIENILLQIKNNTTIEDKMSLIKQYFDNIYILRFDDKLLFPEKPITILHKTTSYNIRRQIKEEGFISDVHYYDLAPYIHNNKLCSVLISMGYSNSLKSLKHIYCFTEVGYKKLIAVLKKSNELDMYVFSKLTQEYFK